MSLIGGYWGDVMRVYRFERENMVSFLPVDEDNYVYGVKEPPCPLSSYPTAEDTGGTVPEDEVHDIRRRARMLHDYVIQLRRKTGAVYHAATRLFWGLSTYIDAFRCIPVYSLAQAKDDPAQVSWAERPEYIFSNKRRRRSSLAKYLNKMVYKGYLDLSKKDIQLLAQEWGKITNSVGYQFEVVRGDDIITAYSNGPYTCMKGEVNLLALYVDNPDKVALLKIHKEGYVGRALLWDCDCCDTIIVDRVYPDDGGPHVSAVLDYAEEQGWLFRDYQGHPAPPDVIRVSDDTWHEVLLKIPSDYPYVDTFTYVSMEGGGKVLLTNYPPDEKHFLSLTTDRGGIDEHYLCDRCNRYAYETSYIDNLGNVCSDCYYEETTVCGECTETVWVEDMLDGICEWCRAA